MNVINHIIENNIFFKAQLIAAVPNLLGQLRLWLQLIENTKNCLHMCLKNFIKVCRQLDTMPYKT